MAVLPVRDGCLTINIMAEIQQVAVSNANMY